MADSAAALEAAALDSVSPESLLLQAVRSRAVVARPTRARVDRRRMSSPSTPAAERLAGIQRMKPHSDAQQKAFHEDSEFQLSNV
jgi:hypothetical protein